MALDDWKRSSLYCTMTFIWSIQKSCSDQFLSLSLPLWQLYLERSILLMNTGTSSVCDVYGTWWSQNLIGITHCWSSNNDDGSPRSRSGGCASKCQNLWFGVHDWCRQWFATIKRNESLLLVRLQNRVLEKLEIKVPVSFPKKIRTTKSFLLIQSSTSICQSKRLVKFLK